MMPFLAAVAYLGLVFKDNDFRTPATSLHRSQHFGPVDKRFADGHTIAVGDKQNPVKFHSTALSRIQMFDFYRLAFGYFILLAAGFNNSVNFEPPK
jgi:hypothetical protein